MASVYSHTHSGQHGDLNHDRQADWAWWDEKYQELNFIYPDKLLLEMCFVYGTQAEIDRGKGVVVDVEVVEKSRSQKPDLIDD